MEFEELCLSITADFHAELNSASMPKNDEDSFVVEDDSVSTSELADIVVPEQKTRTGQKKANKRKQSKNSEQKIQKKKTKLSSNLEAESAPEIIDIDNDSEQNNDVSDPKSTISVSKPAGAVWKHLIKAENPKNNAVLLSCKYCKVSWTYLLDQWRKQGSSTSNQMKHLRRKHNDKLTGNVTLGPMDGFASIKITELASSSNMRNNGVITEDMIREALENFVIADCQPFTLVENRYFLTLLNLCLHYNHTDCFIPKADALKSQLKL